jgi:hypothetical protein
MSIGGIYFTIDHQLLPSSEFDFTTRIPTELTQGREVRIRARGKVVRTEEKKAEGRKRVSIAPVLKSINWFWPNPIDLQLILRTWKIRKEEQYIRTS